MVCSEPRAMPGSITGTHLREFLRNPAKRQPEDMPATAQIFSLSASSSAKADDAPELLASYLELVRTMARRIAEMHLVLLGRPSDPAFSPEPFNDFYRQSLYHGYIGLTTRRLEFIRQRLSEMAPDVRRTGVQGAGAGAAHPCQIQGDLRAANQFDAHALPRAASPWHVLVKDKRCASSSTSKATRAQHLSERRIKRNPAAGRYQHARFVWICDPIALCERSRRGTAKRMRETLRNAGTRLVLACHRRLHPGVLEGRRPGAVHAALLVAHQEILLTTYLLERAHARHP